MQPISKLFRFAKIKGLTPDREAKYVDLAIKTLNSQTPEGNFDKLTEFILLLQPENQRRIKAVYNNVLFGEANNKKLEEIVQPFREKYSSEFHSIIDKFTENLKSKYAEFLPSNPSQVKNLINSDHLNEIFRIIESVPVEERGEFLIAAQSLVTSANENWGLYESLKKLKEIAPQYRKLAARVCLNSGELRKLIEICSALGENFEPALKATSDESLRFILRHCSNYTFSTPSELGSPIPHYLTEVNFLIREHGNEANITVGEGFHQRMPNLKKLDIDCAGHRAEGKLFVHSDVAKLPLQSLEIRSGNTGHKHSDYGIGYEFVVLPVGLSQEIPLYDRYRYTNAENVFMASYPESGETGTKKPLKDWIKQPPPQYATRSPDKIQMFDPFTIMKRVPMTMECLSPENRKKLQESLFNAEWLDVPKIDTGKSPEIRGYKRLNFRISVQKDVYLNFLETYILGYAQEDGAKLGKEHERELLRALLPKVREMAKKLYPDDITLFGDQFDEFVVEAKIVPYEGEPTQDTPYLLEVKLVWRGPHGEKGTTHNKTDRTDEYHTFLKS